MRRRLTQRLLLAFILTLCLGPVFAQSQAPATATLRVRVVDPSEAAIPSAQLKLIGPNDRAQNSTTSSLGESQFAKLAPGKYRLSVAAKGFTPREMIEVEVKPGTNQFTAQLELGQVQEEMVVGQDKRESNTDPRGNAFSAVLTADQIAQLPDDPDELENVIRQMAGPGATLRVNGFRGGKLPPKNQIREIRFRLNPYAAENHEAGFIAVDIFTKPGIEAWHGSFNGGFRDESLNARNPIATRRGPEQMRRFAFDLGGPLWRNHTSLFLNADGANEYDTKTILAATPNGQLNDLIFRPWRRLNLAARLEHALTKTHTLRSEYQRNTNRRNNLGVGDFDLPERAYSTDATENIFRIADSGAISKKLFNELRFQTRWNSTNIDSLYNSPTTIVQGAFNAGGAQIDSNRRLTEIEVADNVDLPFGKHLMRAGLLFEAERQDNRELRNTLGTFTFASLADFQAGRPINYTARTGNPDVEFTQYQLGWYWQDDFRVRKDLSLSFGLRHEWQNTLTDRNNFAPRFGLAWSPFKNGKTTFRAGTGIFYDWFAAEYFDQTLRVDGRRQVDTVIRNPGYPNPTSGGQAIILPPSKIQVADDLRQPTIYQTSVGVERQLPLGIMARFNYVYQRGIHLLRGRNINAPLTSGTRPDPTLGNITQIESSANSFNHTFMAGLNWARPNRFMFGINYMLAKNTNEADSPTALPANNFNLRGERGPAMTDIRHRFFIISNYTLWGGFRLGTSLQYNSASPYNITTGFDNNNDSVINDRPAGVTRNSARGADRFDLSTRLSWGTSWGKPRENVGGGGPQVRIIRAGDSGDMLGGMPSMGGANNRYRVEFYVQAYNALNNVNPTGFSGVQTSPFFGRSFSAMPGRRLETGMRFSF
jgi:hypothetical protein